MNSARLLLLACVAMATVSCQRAADQSPAAANSQSPPPPASSAARAGAVPSEAELRRYVAEGPDRTLREIQAVDYWLQFEFMRSTGIVEALGGEGQAMAALQALGDAYERKLRAAERDMPRMIRTMTGEGLTSGFTGMGIGSFVSTITGGMLSGSVSSMSDDELSALTKAGAIKSNGESGSAEMQFGEDGSLTQALEFAVNESGLNGTVRTRTRMDACPDVDGRVSIDIEVDSTMTVVGKPGTGGSVHTEFKYERYLDDDAHLMNSDGSAANMRIRMSGQEGSASQGTDMTLGYDRAGHSIVEERDAHGFGIFRPEDQKRAGKLMTDALLLQTLMAEVMLRGLGSKSGSTWESGRCVDLRVTSTPAKRKGLRPSTAFTLEAMPRAKPDGSPAHGTVRATLSGGSFLNPANTKVRADARFDYAGPDKKQETATVEFEARSKRGVGRATLEFDTLTAQGYSVKGGAPELRFAGQTCDLSSTFFVESEGALNRVTLRFEPASKEGGRYSYSGTMSGYDKGEKFTFRVHGQGRYRVNFTDDVAVSIDAEGPGTVETPYGPQTAEGAEHYALMPLGDGASCGSPN